MLLLLENQRKLPKIVHIEYELEYNDSKAKSRFLTFLNQQICMAKSSQYIDRKIIEIDNEILLPFLSFQSLNAKIRQYLNFAVESLCSISYAKVLDNFLAKRSNFIYRERISIATQANFQN